MFSENQFWKFSINQNEYARVAVCWLPETEDLPGSSIINRICNVDQWKHSCGWFVSCRVSLCVRQILQLKLKTNALTAYTWILNSSAILKLPSSLLIINFINVPWLAIFCKFRLEYLSCSYSWTRASVLSASSIVRAFTFLLANFPSKWRHPHM